MTLLDKVQAENRKLEKLKQEYEKMPQVHTKDANDKLMILHGKIIQSIRKAGLLEAQMKMAAYKRNQNR